MRKLYVPLFSLFTFIAISTRAQVASYAFTQAYSTYTPVTGGTLHSTTADDANYTAIPLGFNFTFNGTVYTAVTVSSNGFVSFGATAPGTTNYAPISSATAYEGAISIYGRDMIGGGTGSELRSVAIGTAPNRIFVIQFTNWRRYNGGGVLGDVLNGQIRLYETSNVVEIMYGSNIAINTTSLTIQVGLRGLNNTDFNNRLTTANWNLTTTGVANSATVTTLNTILPSNGLTFRWTPPTAACAGTPAAGTVNGLSTICSGVSDTLNVSGYSFPQSGISIQWQSATVLGGPYANIPNAATNIYIATPGATTYYQAVITCSNGAGAATTVPFTVNVIPSPAISALPVSPSICAGSSVSITASGGITYTWSPATGLNTTTGATVIASPSSTTTYTVTGSNGTCSNTANVTVTVLSPPTLASVTATPSTICVSGNSQLKASGSVAGLPTVTYTLSPLSGQTYNTLSGTGITIINTNAQLTPTMGSGSQDDGGVVITLPFTFTYMGSSFTQMSMCTNGWVGAGNQGTIDAVSMRAPGNLFTSTIPNNTIAAWFRDMGANFPLGVGSMRHGLVGTDVYAFQWDKANGSSFGDNATVLISFQINIYGPNSITPGRIELIYGPTVGTISTGSSIGIEDGIGGTDHYINALTGNGTTTTTSSAWPGVGSGYRFDPVQPGYIWTPSIFLSATNISNPVATNITTSTGYSVTATAPNGCITTGNVTVFVDQAAAPSMTPPSATLCNGQIQPLTLSSVNSAAVSTTTSGAITVAIPDNSATGTTHTLNVSGIPANAIITNIQATFNITHTFDGDLVINLKGPNSKVLNLVNQKGAGGDNFLNTSIASYSGLPAVSTGAAPFTGTFAPDGILGVGPTGYPSDVINFAGLFSSVNGAWTLAIQDAGNLDVGTLTSWTITIYYLKSDNIVWSPVTELYTDAGANTAYTGTNLSTVYAKPTVTRTYTATATTTGGCTPTATNVTITVNQLPAVTSQPGNQSICPGQTATFTVGATGAGITYQWYRGATLLTNGGNIAGATSATLIVSNATVADAGNYTVVISGTCAPPATSNIAVLAVGAPPIITSQPLANQIACAGNTVSFTVASSSTGLTYQWYHGAILLTNGGNISGATSATLTVTNIAVADAGNYTVVLTNACALSTTSAAGVLTFSASDRWLGVANSDWNNASNWCNGVPTSTTDVVIPAGTAFPAILTVNSDVRNLQIDAGASLTVAASGLLNIYGSTLTVNGTFPTTAGTIAFRNTANLNVPALTVANVVMNGTGGITLTGSMNVTTALTLTSGNITLGSNNVVMTGGTIGSAASHIVTNGTGVVTNNNITVAAAAFPVGPTAASYNPVLIANGQGLNYSVRVAVGLPGTLANAARAINRTWTITASGSPAADVGLNFGYADADANASCTPTANMEIGYFSGTSWALITTAGGAPPAGTATLRTVTATSRNFGTMVVANSGGILNIVTATPNLNADIYSVRLMPNIVSEQTLLRVVSRRAMNVEWSITDIQGRVVMKFNHGVSAGQNDITLKLGTLASGTYQIVGYTDKGTTSVTKFVRL